ncbi:hypothetical protein ACFE04_027840 [Oxalis oulophora]
MYKARLQEFCQQRNWPIPSYNAIKHGLDHCPQFNASVVVNGQSFTTDSLYKSSKEAHNMVAMQAFEHLTQSPSAFTSTDNNSRGTTSVANQIAGTSPVVKNDRIKEPPQMYKNHLQVYAQKRSLALPEYATEREGPPHACRFKSKVTVHGQTFETPDFFSTLKEAENAAATLAVSALLPEGVNEENSGFYKNLLQEFAQKGGHLLPTYITERTGNSHAPTFTSTVELGGRVFVGMVAKTKKQAEMNVAKAAYLQLTEGESSNITASTMPTYQSPMAYCSTGEDVRAFPQPGIEFVAPQFPTPIVRQQEFVLQTQIPPPIVRQQEFVLQPQIPPPILVQQEHGLQPQIPISIARQELNVEEQHLNHNIPPQKQAVEVQGSTKTGTNDVSPIVSLSINNVNSANDDDGEGRDSMVNAQTEVGHEYLERVLVRPRLQDMTFPPKAVVNYSNNGKWVCIRVKNPVNEDVEMMYGGLK